MGIASELEKRRGWVVMGILAVSLVVTLAMGIQARGRILKKQRTGSVTQVNDFERWMKETPRFLEGRAWYIDDSLPTPPVTLLVFAPLTRLSEANAQLAWAMCKWVFVVGIGWCCWRMAVNAGVRPAMWAVLMGLGVWMWAVMGDVQQGQTNLLMLWPLCGGLLLIQNSEFGIQSDEKQGARIKKQEGRWRVAVWGGILVALAAGIKVTPLIFLVYFMWRRRWWAVLGMMVGMVLWLVAVPGLVFGYALNLVWLEGWVRVMILPYVMHGKVDYYVGQSVASFVTRLVRHVSAFPDRPVYVNVLDLPEAVANGVVRGILLAMAASGWLWMRKRMASLRSVGYVLEVGVVAVFMLWASQRTWVPHYVSMVLAVTGMVVVMSDERQDARLRKQAAWVLAAGIVLMMMTSDMARVMGKDGGEWMRTVGVSLWATAGMVWVLVRGKTMNVER